MPSKRIVYIVEGDAAVRRALKRALGSAGYEVVTYEGAPAFLATAAGLSTGCLLLGLRMPGLDGLELCSLLQAMDIRLPVVMMMSGNGDVQSAVRALKAGAVRFIDKPFSDATLLAAVEATFLNPSVISRRHQISEAARQVSALTPRERQVLDGLVAGQSSKEIARALGISVRTVEVHRRHMMHRLGTRQLSEAIRLAVMASFASDEEPELGEGA